MFTKGNLFEPAGQKNGDQNAKVRKEERRKRRLERPSQIGLDAKDEKPKAEKRKVRSKSKGERGEKPRTHNLIRPRTLQKKRVVVGTQMYWWYRTQKSMEIVIVTFHGH